MEQQIQDIYSIFEQHPSVSTDTRNIKKGDLFFALKGPHFDANALAIKAIEQGASYAIVDDKSLPQHPQLIQVNNVLKSLQHLANYHRKKMNATVIGITGSNGKTTTKELVARVLSKKYTTLFTEGNLNNHIGVPLTLLRLKSDTEMAVIEMGANHIGEIRQMCLIAEPNFGIITNIGKAHLEGFGGAVGVINAKSELYAYIDDHAGMLFVNKDNALLNRLSANIKRFTFGSDLSNDLYCELVSSDPYLNIAWEYRSSQSVVYSRIIGSYNAENIAAAIAIGCYFGVEKESVNHAIEQYQSENNRSQLVETKKNRVILDAYNANPNSMEAAIRNFDKMRERKAWLILGDMLELGNESDHEHANILKLVTDLDFNHVILVGPLFERVYGGDDWHIFPDVEKLAIHLQKKPIENCDILLKGSRGIQLEKAFPLL